MMIPLGQLGEQVPEGSGVLPFMPVRWGGGELLPRQLRQVQEELYDVSEHVTGHGDAARCEVVEYLALDEVVDLEGGVLGDVQQPRRAVDVGRDGGQDVSPRGEPPTRLAVVITRRSRPTSRRGNCLLFGLSVKATMRAWDGTLRR